MGVMGVLPAFGMQKQGGSSVSYTATAGCEVRLELRHHICTCSGACEQLLHQKWLLHAHTASKGYLSVELAVYRAVSYVVGLPGCQP